MYSHDCLETMPQAAAGAACPEKEVLLPLWLSAAEIEFLMGLCLVAPRREGVDAMALQRLVDAWQGMRHR